jgi:hypothetical protein
MQGIYEHFRDWKPRLPVDATSTVKSAAEIRIAKLRGCKTIGRLHPSAPPEMTMKQSQYSIFSAGEGDYLMPV